MTDSFSKKSIIKNLAICISCAVAASVLFYNLSESYVISQAEKNIQNLLLSHKGIHHYVQRRMLPALYEYKKENKIPEEFYAPELFSSSFIVRNQHEYYNQELKDAGFPELYYKLAANNPRNPINKADALEKELIEKFNDDRSLKKHREIINIGGDEHLYIAIPFLENTKPCMICHGKRENAPKELQAKYPGEGGFNEKIGEIRAITSIRAPLNKEHQQIIIIVASLVTGTLFVAFLAFFNSRLRTKVQQSTESLESEIKEKHEIATRLSESENYLKSIQDSMQVGLLLIDRKSHDIVDVNKVALELIGLDREDVIGKQCFRFICPSERGCCPINDHDQKVDKSEKTLISSQGNEIPVLKTATKIRISGNEYILETFIDISEQKRIERDRAQLESRLNQSQKLEAIGTLAGGIAHDFNNILGVILGYADLAKDDALPNSHLQNDLNNICIAGNRAKDLVRQILAFSRQSQTNRAPLLPAPIIKEVIKMLRSSLPTTIQINEKIDSSCGIIDADPTQLYQVVMNVCTNAFHAMEDTGGILTIELKNAENLKDLSADQINDNIQFIHLSIGDTGHGMTDELIKKIFDPFFTTKEKGKGTGLGLSTTYGIIKEYGGMIKVNSQIGKGTTFDIFIPRSKSDGVSVESDKESIPLGKERILLIDDEELLLNMGKAMLQRLGYSVTAVSRSFEALTVFQNQPKEFDLVITDQTMPGMTGIDLARRMMQIRPDIPIILCTGYSSIVPQERAKSVGIKEFILKPVVKNELANLIRKVLRKEH